MQKPLQITVGAGGINPAAGDTDYANPALKGQEGYVTRSGYGILPYSDYQVLGAGGIRLLNWAFGANEVYFFVPTGIVYEGTQGNYSNGFNMAAVMAAMFGRMGFQNSTITKYAGYANNTNSASSSGRYFNEVHALVTVPNILNCQEDPDISKPDFNALLETYQRGVIMRALNGVLNEREKLEEVLLFDRYGLNDTPIVSTDRFCGYEIKVAKSFDIAVQIEAITLFFDSDITFPLYLFKDGKQSPVWSKQVTAVANEATIVNVSDLILTYIGEVTKGHRFFLGYFQADLGNAKAYWELAEMFSPTCCFAAVGFETNKIPNALNFNRNQPSYTYKNYGLNLQVSSFKDWTNSIKTKAFLFDELIILCMGFKILEMIIYSVRSNGTERLLKEDIDRYSAMLDLNGVVPVSNSPYMSGLNKRIERELLRVKKGFYPKPKASTINFTDGQRTNFTGRDGFPY